MGFEHQIQRQRFEYKYLIDEATAHSVRDFARSYLQHDEHARPEMGYSYPIYSLYLDSPGLTLYRSTIEGMMNRFKLRIRYYDDNPRNPVFFEIKRRVNECILKERAVVKRDRMHALIMGKAPDPTDLLKPHDLKSFSSLTRFCELGANIHAAGQVIVAYNREAWVSPNDDAVRLTFDRDLATAAYHGTLLNKKWTRPHVEHVVLELKFDNRFPLWMQELVRNLNLYRTSFPKYVHCIEAMPNPNSAAAYLLRRNDGMAAELYHERVRLHTGRD